MHTPYRLASPPEPPPTDEADSYELQLVAATKRERRTRALLVILALGVVSLVVVAVSPHYKPKRAGDAARQRLAERTEHARTTIDEAARSAAFAEGAFQLEVRAAADGKIAVAMPPTACSVTLPEPDRVTRSRGALPFLVVGDHERGTLRSASLARVWRDIHHAEGLLASASPASAVVYADALEATPVEARLAQEIILVRTKLRRPVRSSPTSYEPGAVDGVAYLYDFREHKVLCAGEIHATNTRSLEYSFNDRHDAPTWQDQRERLDATLEDDLDAQVARAIAAPGALYAIATPR